MELLVSNGWTQLWVLIATSVLCVAMSLWLGAHHFRLHKQVPIVARTTTADIGNTQPRSPTLHITDIVQHGRIVEIKGVTDAGTVVMINGQPAASIFPENTFRHFLGPLPRGTSIVSVTCQDEQGGVTTQQLAVTLE
jgi:hypothetical protein